MTDNRTLQLQVGLALSVWALWYALGGDAALAAVVAHWPVTLTMVFGSFIAGATAEGGGAVAFPVFTKVLYIAPADARVFALAIQSLGMTSAALVILIARIPVDWAMLRWGSIGGLVGLLLGTLLVVPLVTPTATRLAFTVIQGSFAVALLLLNRNGRATHQRIPCLGGREKGILIAAGLLGGVAASLVGSGLDIVVFSVVVLLFRVSEKVATPTSVILMAGYSLAGFALHGLVLGNFTPEIRDWWLAAIPVVVVSAPLGALVCSRLSRIVIVRALIVLIAIEVSTTLILVPIDRTGLVVSAIALVSFGSLYGWMARQRTYEPGWHQRAAPVSGATPQGEAASSGSTR